MLGLVAGAIPGHMLMAIITKSLASGLKSGLVVLFQILILESLVALFILILFSYVDIHLGVFYVISLIGALVLVYIAVQMFKINSLGDLRHVKFSFKQLMILVFSNGMLWIYWITACLPLAMKMDAEFLYGKYISFFFIELGWFVSTLAFVPLFLKMRSLILNPKYLSIVFKCFSLVFLYFSFDIVLTAYKYFIA
jgi:threonine/homoserine/homoserine lactone efflux protein